MTTYTWPSGKIVDVRPNDAGVTVFDAKTNSPYWLHDWDAFRSEGISDRFYHYNYPLIIDNAADNCLFDGGHFYGNIDENIDWDNFYMGGRDTIAPIGVQVYTGFNGTLIQPRGGKRYRFQDNEWGIRDNLNSGYVDGVQGGYAGGMTFIRPRVWIGRDDWFEADDVNNRDHYITDGFFENLFVWLSGTGNIPGSTFHATHCLVHFRRWLYQGNLTHGPLLKVWGGGQSPNFRFNDVTIAMSPFNPFDTSYIFNALAKTQAENNCRLLILGGTHVNRPLITAFQNAGFTVLEDGAGTAATEEWNLRKSIFLEETVDPPPVITRPALSSPAVLSGYVGTPPPPVTLVAPEILDIVVTGPSGSVSNVDINTPAWDAGDLIILAPGIAGGLAAWPTLAITPPDGESVLTEQVLVDNDDGIISDGWCQALGLNSFIAGSTYGTAGTRINIDFGYGDSHMHTLIRVKKDTFIEGAVNRLAMVAKTAQAAVSSVPVTSLLTDAPNKSLPFGIAMSRYSGSTDTGFPPAGWSGVRDYGDWSTILAMHRPALSAIADVPAVNFRTNNSGNGWTALTEVILPKGHGA